MVLSKNGSAAISVQLGILKLEFGPHLGVDSLMQLMK